MPHLHYAPTSTRGSQQAAAPAVHDTQVPGYFRYAVGDFVVTALLDGYADLNIQMLTGLPADQIQSLLARSFIEGGSVVLTAVNTFLVNTGKHLVLVDAGSGNALGPTMGKLLENIRAAGYTPEEVDTLLLTHLDPDHVCGLVDNEGKPVFPNAALWAPQEDIDFRTDEKLAAAAPEGTKPFFQMVVNAIKPYLATGKLRGFKIGDTLPVGVDVIAAHGHTPGHCAYLFNSGNQTLATLGDIVHNHAVQFPHPEVAVQYYDQDQNNAIASRKALFERAAELGWVLAGTHIPFPGLGHIRREAEGYAWVPVEFGPFHVDR